MKTLIVEVSGGVVQEVYTDAKNLDVILVDWDAGESPGDNFAGGKLRPCTISQIPNDTARAVAALTT